MIFFKKDYCKSFYFGLNFKIWVYLVVQFMEMFDELVESDKVIEEILSELFYSVVINSGKSVSDSVLGWLFKSGYDSYVSGSCVKYEIRPSQFKQYSSTVVCVNVSVGSSGWLFL